MQAGAYQEHIMTTDTPKKTHWQPQNSYSYDDLIASGHGKVFGDGNARLPLPNMLMMSRIVEINDHGGDYGKGYIKAELDITPDLWFFGCHFKGDPVMPGCLGLDAMWQLVGFFLGWCGGPGKGRALGVKDLIFRGQILPTSKKVTYILHMSRVIKRKLFMGLADGYLDVDGRVIYEAKDLKVGLFTSTDGF